MRPIPELEKASQTLKKNPNGRVLSSLDLKEFSSLDRSYSHVKSVMLFACNRRPALASLSAGLGPRRS